MDNDFSAFVNRKVSRIKYDYIDQSAAVTIVDAKGNVVVAKFLGCVGILDHGVIRRDIMNVYFNSKGVGILFFEMLRIKGLDSSPYKEIIINTGSHPHLDYEIELRIAFKSHSLLDGDGDE